MPRHYTRRGGQMVARRRSSQGVGERWVEGKSFRLADGVRYIQGKAAEHDGRVVSFGQLVLFSADTGDAWLIDVAGQLAAPLARNRDPESIHLEETDTSFAIGWKGHYCTEGSAFIYIDRDPGRIRTIFGYPTKKIAQAS